MSYIDLSKRDRPAKALPIAHGWAQASFNLCIVLPIVAGFAVAGRFLSRRIKHVSLGVDDWLVLAALVSVLVLISKYGKACLTLICTASVLGAGNSRGNRYATLIKILTGPPDAKHRQRSHTVA